MKVIKEIARYVIFLFRGNFFHYNVMIFYYSINSPLSQISPNLQQNRSVFSVCRRPSGTSPPTPLRMERGVITEIPLHVLRMLSNPSPSISRPVGVTSHTTPLSIRRGVGGEASVFSVCRRRSVCSKCAPKTSVNSVRSVREKTPQRFSSVLSLTVDAFYFSQKNTPSSPRKKGTSVIAYPL